MLGPTITALGIDITDDKISLALVRRSRGNIKLLKAASKPLPADAVKDGNIKNPAAVAKAIRELKRSQKMRAGGVAASLCAKPVLVLLADMPRPAPPNVRQFVQSEVKQCVVLPGKRVAFDFCGIGAGGRAAGNRLFVVAADGESLTDVARAYNQAHLNVGVIEPPLLAYIRLLYGKRIAGKFSSNVLIAILRGGVLTLCVFRNQAMDFVRTKDIGKEETGSDVVCKRLAEEIKAVIQFYDFEVPEHPGKWEVTVVTDDVQLPQDAQESLKGEINCTELAVRSGENAWRDVLVDQDGSFDKASSVAIGLAMKFLDTKGSSLKIDLFPAEASEVKIFRKDFLVAANVIAAVILMMVLAVGGLILATEKANQSIIVREQTRLLKDTYILLKEQESIDKQIVQLSNKPEWLDKVLSLHEDVGWSDFLNDVRKATPKTVRITSLSTKGKLKVLLNGLALSYEAVHLYVGVLNRSNCVASASLVETEKDEHGSRLVKYAIDCSLKPKEKK